MKINIPSSNAISKYSSEILVCHFEYRYLYNYSSGILNLEDHPDRSWFDRTMFRVLVLGE
jgi:hypothetical protein